MEDELTPVEVSTPIEVDSDNWLEILSHAPDFLEQINIRIYEMFLHSLIPLIQELGLPDVLLSEGAINITGGLAWFLSVFEFQMGLEVFTSCYVIRFLIRRIPVIG